MSKPGRRAAKDVLALKVEGGHRDFEFNLRELAGSMGDFGTLFPLAVGFIAINGLNPAGLFIMLGLTNIALGLIYHLPMPLQPKKVIAAVAISDAWSPALIHASGFGLGLMWLLLTFTGLLQKLVDLTPTYLVRGIQLGLGLTLGWQALKMMAPAPLLGVLAVAVVLLLRENRYAPASIVLMALGVAIVGLRGDLRGLRIVLTLPPLTPPDLRDVWQAMLLAGFAQIPLTVGNAVIATAAVIRDTFPERAVSERKLMLNMGVINTIASFLGGMPMCHGAGGFASQVYFGARTGGAPILEGLIEVGIGLFLSQSIADLMAAFPMALVGGMLLLVSVQLGLASFRLRGWSLVVALVTGVVSLLTNIGIGFLAGLALAYGVRALRRRGLLPELPSSGDKESDHA
jgi:sulfate permease, SulP family